MIEEKEKKIFNIVKNFTSIDKVIDVGGFHGNWSDMILSDSPDCYITIFEPDVINFEVLKSKFDKNEKIKLINSGASSEKSKLTYYNIIGDNSLREMSGFVQREIYKKYKIEEVQVMVVRIDDIYEDIDFLKIDTEGFEFNVIKGCEKLLDSKKVKFIQFEYGGTYLDNNIYLNDIINYLNKFNYFVYDIDKVGNIKVIQNYVDDYEYNNFLATYIKLV